MRKISIFVSAILFLGIALCFAQEESITITTYYPSPYGSYNELRTYSNTYLATDSGSVGIGTRSPSPTVKLQVSGGDIDVGGGKVMNLAQPSVDSPASHGATKKYVDDWIANLQAQIDVLETQIRAGPGQQLFTSNGTFTVPTGVTRVWVTLVGGGGGGGGGGSVGGQQSGGDGENGGSSSFGAHLLVTGGCGGGGGYAGDGGGAGGCGGSPGGSAGSSGSSSYGGFWYDNPGTGGAGGSGYEGYGAGGSGGSGGRGYGLPSGGGGGGAGGSGFIQARELTSVRPRDTISVTVGGGAGGGRGGLGYGGVSNGTGGGGGGSGFVRVEW